MSTAIADIPLQCELEHPILYALLSRLEADPSLLLPDRWHDRLVALDNLDACFGGFDESANQAHSLIYDRAKALRTRYEAVNAKLYRSLRAEIAREGQPRTVFQRLLGSASRQEFGSPLPGPSFDTRDELVSGILELREPGEPNLWLSREMVPYQPTPVRHVLDLIAAGMLSKDDLLVDLGSGLGHVPLLVTILAGIPTLGIEVQPAYVATAQECAQSLGLDCVRFITQDVRVADMSSGTVFYLYSPFTGSVLTDVLSRLRRESTRRPIRICSLGPCTGTLANQPWLEVNTPPDPDRMTVFRS
jgi:hypothetical protein